MNLLCRAAGHRGLDRETYNGGYFFARCARCNVDLIRDGRSWKAVPHGHRVVWKTGRRTHSVAPDMAHALPIVAASGDAATGPPARRSARRKALVPVPPSRRAPPPPDEEQEAAAPRLLLLFAVAAGAFAGYVRGAGLRGRRYPSR
ncbi:MAG: hypothetical protein JOZ90_16930 [Alphaproteobacteria bacterium]|nr:hypothetical protein [Alphaproteobacteria bacterium]MBV9371502.1 hypothetical protein [Alphaproteobacteria bacterium]MBV9902756.1 hypothetical protein [Alphaproteobacteria bacterium]